MRPREAIAVTVPQWFRDESGLAARRRIRPKPSWKLVSERFTRRRRAYWESFEKRQETNVTDRILSPTQWFWPPGRSSIPPSPWLGLGFSVLAGLYAQFRGSDPTIQGHGRTLSGDALHDGGSLRSRQVCRGASPQGSISCSGRTGKEYSHQSSS